MLDGFVNLTPFAAQPVLLNDERGADIMTFVVKATFSLRVQGSEARVALADEQAPVCLAPVYHGEPGVSSLKYDIEVAPKKPGTDIVLVGHARPTVTRAGYIDVSLAIGPIRSVVRVFGDRVWGASLGRWTASAPQPFEAMPLVYERAFGGWDRSSPDPSLHDYESRNPVGTGFVGKHGTVREGQRLPNLENPYEAISTPTDRPMPLGFGYIESHWRPRAQYAGTYDERWKEQRMPLLPDDFDARFYNGAHPTLVAQGFFGGGERVEVTNASAQGALRFSLPQARPYVTIRTKSGATQRAGMTLDTIMVDSDADQLVLLWRSSMPLPNRIYDVVWAKAQLAQESASS